MGCSPVYPGTFEEVVFFNGSIIPFETSSEYISVCLNVSGYERENDVFFNLTELMDVFLEEYEFLFYVNSYAEYPNLGVIARNGDCFYTELIYTMNNFSFLFVNDSISGSLLITHYDSYVLFIQDKYDSSLMPDNSLKSVFITAPVMERDSNHARLSVVEPLNRLHPIRIKIRGGYGRASPKKSYSLHFLEDVNIHGVEGKVLYLQSQFNDPLLNRNAVSLSLFEALGYVVPKVEFVNVFMNERYVGVYELTNRIDKDLLGMDFALNDPTRVYKINLYGDNCELVESVQTRRSFCDENISLDVNQAIDYYLLTKITGATDNIGKNYFISIDEFETVLIWPWDLDYAFFDVFSEQSLVGDFGNVYLFDVISNNVDRVVDRYYVLRRSYWSDDALIGLVDRRVSLDSSLDYGLYVFPERLPVVDFVDFILGRVAFLDDDFRSIVLSDLDI